jgi:hypothetical protein
MTLAFLCGELYAIKIRKSCQSYCGMWDIKLFLKAMNNSRTSFAFYNHERLHQASDYKRPLGMEVQSKVVQEILGHSQNGTTLNIYGLSYHRCIDML